MAKDNGANFEIPPQMREFAEKSVEQAKQAFDSFVAAAQHAVKTAENQAATTQTGAKEVGALAMQYAERNMQFLVRFRPEAAEGQGHQRSDGAASRLRQRPDGGPDRAGQGIGQASDQNGRAKRRSIEAPTQV